MKKRKLLLGLAIILLIALGVLFLPKIMNNTPQSTEPPATTLKATQATSTPVSSNTSSSSTTSPSVSPTATSEPSATAVTPESATPTLDPESEDPQKYRANGDTSSDFTSAVETTDSITANEYSAISIPDSFGTNSKYLNYSVKSNVHPLFNNILNDTLNGDGLTHAQKFSSYLKYPGIDVSEWQGTIDWNAVANSGVRFAIIRCGYRGYVTGRMVEDKQFAANMSGAIRNGIKVGVYFFSMAVNESEAAEEAQFVLDRISNYSLSLPIYMDTEFSGDDQDRLRDANLSANAETNCVLSFCNRVKSHGLSAGQYASASYLEDNVNAADVVAAGNRIWLAHYTAKTYYTGEYDIWQHCGYNGHVSIPGISGYVDCNIWYVASGVTIYNNLDYSPIYDFQYYLAANPDLKAAYGDNNDAAVLSHFVNYGMSEGRRGNSAFDVYSYKNAYSDLRSAYGNNMKSYYMHYLLYGRNEGRNQITGVTTINGFVTTYKGINYAAVYDLNYYLKSNPNVKAKFSNNDDTAILADFVNAGMSEGRIAIETFDVNAYKNAYSDLRIAFGNNLKAYYMHYIQYGKAEGRVLTTAASSQQSTTQSTATPAPESMPSSTNTKYNGIDYSIVYNYQYYLTANPDVKAYYGTDNEAAVFMHFITCGMQEGRRANETFNISAYKNKQSDLRQAFGNNLKAYYIHYIEYGKAEGRICS